jgi:site-specific recombinase XerD
MGKGRINGPLNSNSTISNIRAIRTIVYEALREGNKFTNPFLVKKLKEFKGVRGKLTIEEIKKLESLKIEKDSSLWHTLNYFLFSFYAAGTRFTDVAQLKWKNIQGDRLSFIMEKTDEGHSVILIQKALNILEHYKKVNNSPDSFVFPILDRLPKDADSMLIYTQISSKNAMINKDLKKIQKIAELETKMIFHLSRHSFADILRTKEISIYDISKLLGHSDIKITERYFKGFDNKTSDEALKNGMDF